jgi:imidazolonepropionase-like amidohydrolase
MPIKTIIRNARVLTMDAGDTILDRANVLIDGDMIVGVGPDAAFADAAGVRVIDGAGKLVMPGLVNAHFHSPGQSPEGLARQPAARSLHALRIAGAGRGGDEPARGLCPHDAGRAGDAEERRHRRAGRCLLRAGAKRPRSSTR